LGMRMFCVPRSPTPLMFDSTQVERFFFDFLRKGPEGSAPRRAAAKDTQAASTPPSLLDGSSQAATAASVVDYFRLGAVWAL